jgi:putative photosynthetic complex assembly protein
MTEHSHDAQIPRGILLGGAALTGVGRYQPTIAPVTETRPLQFVDRAEGGVAIIDAGSGATIRVLQPGQDGFIRATVRTMAQERIRRGLSPSVPFELKRHAQGSLSFEDPTTGRVVSLDAFGSTNRAAFASLLD